MPSQPTTNLWNALIRTHHITSRKKVGKLKAAAKSDALFVLLRSGATPGMMYVEGAQAGVQRWVDTVHGLRYKDYQLVHKPAALSLTEARIASTNVTEIEAFEEESSVSAFGQKMSERGLWTWWRAGMGYIDSGTVQDPS